MNNLIVIVEGETEQTFVRDQLAAHLAVHGTSAWPILPGRHRNHGGVKKWEVAKRDIIYALRGGQFCSTMFDFYAMPLDWPGRQDAPAKSWEERAAYVEKMIHNDVVQAMGQKFDPKYFIPYVQLHEFEALTFSKVEVLASVIAPLAAAPVEALRLQFQAILDDAKHPEAINDNYETCPSRRIEGIVPAYRKRVHGPIVTGRIGFDVLCSKCDHFASWISRLEDLK